MNGFHDVLFPIDISLRSRGGPQRMTDIATTGSGREERNQRWYASRRRYDAGYGIKTLATIASVIEFFEERRGMLYGFRWRDKMDYRSCSPAHAPAPTDQPLVAAGPAGVYQLCKTYGATYAPYRRTIAKPVHGSVRIAVDGTEIASSHYSVDVSTGLATFAPAHAPDESAVVTAGFLFDVPVRFDSDFLEVDLAAFEAGEIPKVPVVEILA